MLYVLSIAIYLTHIFYWSSVLLYRFGYRTSVPAIWITRKFIGGFNDGPSEYNGLNTLNTKGELGAMLKYVPKTKHSSPR